jgi:16S rRNA (uracil1498-N3)-methyltransferase
LTQHLSNIELYYTLPQNISENRIIVEGEEYSHITRVMRHSVKDELYVTDGRGKIYSGAINKINKNNIELEIENVLSYENRFKNICLCIPKLKSIDRLEFALEKCAELGITNFIIFDSERTVSKADKIERWEKILLSAMKQSLNSFLPKLEVLNFNNIVNLAGVKIGFEQSSLNKIDNLKLNTAEKYYLVFGPEGGLSNKELNFFEKENIYKIADNRLRTETAVVAAASIINFKLNRES